MAIEREVDDARDADVVKVKWRESQPYSSSSGKK